MILHSRKALGVFHETVLLLFLVFIVSSSTTISVNAEYKHEQQPISSKASQNNEYILEIASPLSSFIQDNLENHNIAHVRYTYDTDILTGAAIEFKNYKVARQLIDHPDVLNAWPIHHRVGLHAPVPEFSNVNKDKEDDNASEATFFVPQDKDTLRVLTSKNYIYENLKSNGSGVKIGIIDTGVDYTHPALGGCFGEGCKIAYGYDLVGNDFDGTLSSIKESNDPIDNCPKNSTSATGHGTFVAGIIGAEDKEYNWTGIAPGATLGMWKVYGCNNPGSPNDIMVKAMEMAYKAGMDVISISLGVSGGWEEDILSVMADRLVSKGVHVATASGNSGSKGIFLTASPASGKNVIAAGATLNSHVSGYILKLEDKHETDLSYRTFVNTPLVLNDSLPIVASGQSFNQENDACQNLTRHKYNDSIVLIHQGGCNSLIKVKHAQEAGAKAVVIYTDTHNSTTSIEVLSNAVLPVAFINNNDAKVIHSAISSKDSKTKARFTNVLLAMEAPEQDIDSIGSFSSLGPTNELQLKPELVAIGGNVFSTLPTYQKSYGLRSGTSFSCPYIAGSVAVFLSNLNNTNQSPDLVKNILMNFASPVKPPISALPYGDSPIRQGAGVVDVAQAIHGFGQFHVSPAKLSLNDTANSIQEHEITLYNHHDTEELVLKLDHDPSLTVTGYSLNGNQTFTPSEPIGMYAHNNSVATLQFSDTKLVVPAGKSVKVRVRVQPPVDTFKPESHVLYGGYITVSSSTSKAQVPYFGMIGNMKDLPILDRAYKPTQAVKYTFPSIASAGGSAVESDKEGHFHIQYNQERRVSVGGPYVLVRLLTGTAILQFQVMDAQGENVIADVPIDSTRTWMMRNTLDMSDYSQVYYTWYWAGEYVEKDSTLYGETSEQPNILESGEYRLKVRGLRVYGDRTKTEDWDEWISPKLVLDIDDNSNNKD